MKPDVLIIGTGVSGLYAALNLNSNLNISIITNSDRRKCNSYLAQGGITTIQPGDEVSFIEDSLIAGQHKNSFEALDIAARESWGNVETLIKMGADFQRDETGNLKFTREAAHSKRRILFHGSETGKMLVETLLKNVEKRKNITIIENTELLDLKITDQKVHGGTFKNKDRYFSIDAKIVILATGGIGGLFKSTTNQPNIKGISLALAEKYNIETKDVNYIQLHPTALNTIEESKLFLLSEALRGEGAVIRDSNKKRFIDELLPRDVVAQAILEKKRETGCEVYLDATGLEAEYLKERFSGIYRECLERGYDITRDLLPISPAQHYFMGGIKVDMEGRTSCEFLYAVGEAACTGLHGKNRLASNSLLEAVVFSRRAAQDINSRVKDIQLIEKKVSEDKWNPEETAKQVILKHREDLKNEFHNN